MPKVVDHEARRADIAAAAFRVVARKGILQATIADVARECGFSVGAIIHYLPTRDHILLEALEYGSIEVRRRMDTAATSAEGLEALRRVVHEALPGGPDMASHWRIWVSLWEVSYASETARAVLHGRYDESYRRYGDLVRAAQARGEVDPDVDVDEAVGSLISLIDGLSTHVLVAGRRLSDAVLKQHIEDWIRDHLTDPRPRPGRSV